MCRQHTSSWRTHWMVMNMFCMEGTECSFCLKLTFTNERASDSIYIQNPGSQVIKIVPQHSKNIARSNCATPNITHNMTSSFI